MNTRTKPKGKPRLRRRFNWFDVFLLIFCVGFALVCFYPIWYVFVVSITPYSEFVGMDFILMPVAFDMQYYKAIFASASFLNSFWVSVLKTFAGTLSAVLVTAMMAYGVSKLEVPGMKTLNKLVVFTMYFGGGLIPTYMLYRDIGILKTFWPMVLPMVLNVSYFIIMRNYYRHSAPRELEEAALIDGANQATAFFRIVLPTTIPMIAAISLFIGVWHWNDWYSFMMFVNRSDMQPLSWMLRRILVDPAFTNNMAAAAEAIVGYKPPPLQLRMTTIIVATTPILIAYPFLQKYFTKGLMLGAVKG